MKVIAFPALGFVRGSENKVKGEENCTAMTDNLQQSFLSCRHAQVISVYDTDSALLINLSVVVCVSKSARDSSIKAESVGQRDGRWHI
jgi:hypothetical protein